MPPRRHTSLYGGLLMPPGGTRGRGTGADWGREAGQWIGDRVEDPIRRLLGIGRSRKCHRMTGRGSTGSLWGREAGQWIGDKVENPIRNLLGIGRRSGMKRGRGKYGKMAGEYVGGLVGVPGASTIAGKIGDYLGDKVYDLAGRKLKEKASDLYHSAKSKLMNVFH